MSNEDELVKTLINKKTKKQKNSNNPKQQQINKVVIDYDRVVIALPHFPKPPKVRINARKTLPDHTPIAAIRGFLGDFKSKKKKRKIKSDGFDERKETHLGNGFFPNGVDDFEGLNKQKRGLSDGKDDNFEGKKKKKKDNLGERNEPQLGNGVDDFEGLNKVVKRKHGWSKDEGVECRFPVNRIARIIKTQGDDYKLGHEAVFLINKATEKFIELFSEDAYDCALEDKKSFVGYRHLSSTVGKEKRLDFLSDYVPEKIMVEKALSARKATETSPS